MILPNVRDIRRKWAKIGPFLPKIRWPSLRVSYRKTRFVASGMWNFAWVRFKTGAIKNEQLTSTFLRPIFCSEYE